MSNSNSYSFCDGASTCLGAPVGGKAATLPWVFRIFAPRTGGRP